MKELNWLCREDYLYLRPFRERLTTLAAMYLLFLPYMFSKTF